MKSKISQAEAFERTALEKFRKERPERFTETNLKRLYYLRSMKGPCPKSCSPSDWCRGGKCDLEGCYYEDPPGTDIPSVGCAGAFYGIVLSMIIAGVILILLFLK